MHIAFCTTPEDKAESIADFILESKLAACVNIVSKVKSKYWWDNKIQCDQETLLIIKTREELINPLIEKIKEIHPYDVPEIIFIKIENGNKDYLDWIKNVT